MTLSFEWVNIIPNTCIKAEVNDLDSGWWETFLTNTETGDFSGVRSFHLDFPLTHEQAAKIALEIWIAKGIDT